MPDGCMGEIQMSRTDMSISVSHDTFKIEVGLDSSWDFPLVFQRLRGSALLVIKSTSVIVLDHNASSFA